MKQVDHTNSEQGILLAISHPFIINLWGTFQDATNLYMIMDFVHGGELFTLLRKAQGGVRHLLFSLPVLVFFADLKNRDFLIPSPSFTPRRLPWRSITYTRKKSYTEI
jgi:serine/threonine protein kinase